MRRLEPCRRAARLSARQNQPLRLLHGMISSAKDEWTNQQISYAGCEQEREQQPRENDPIAGYAVPLIFLIVVLAHLTRLIRLYWHASLACKPGTSAFHWDVARRPPIPSALKLQSKLWWLAPAEGNSILGMPANLIGRTRLRVAARTSDDDAKQRQMIMRIRNGCADSLSDALGAWVLQDALLQTVRIVDR